MGIYSPSHLSLRERQVGLSFAVGPLRIPFRSRNRSPTSRFGRDLQSSASAVRRGDPVTTTLRNPGSPRAQASHLSPIPSSRSELGRRRQLIDYSAAQLQDLMTVRWFSDLRMFGSGRLRTALPEPLTGQLFPKRRHFAQITSAHSSILFGSAGQRQRFPRPSSPPNTPHVTHPCTPRRIEARINRFSTYRHYLPLRDGMRRR